MAKKQIIALLLILVFVSCSGQNKKELNIEKNLPKTDVKVTKEYDKNGNLIRLDSTYTYYYSSNNKDTLFSNFHLKEFKNNFNTQFESLDSLFLKDYFLKEHFKINEFFNENFFEDNFKKNQKEIENIMKQMDSLRLHFYKMNSKELKDHKKKL